MRIPAWPWPADRPADPRREESLEGALARRRRHGGQPRSMVSRSGAWRRELLQRLPGLALAMASGGLLVHLWTSEELRVREPQVEGNRVVPTAHIVEITQVQGRHIFTIDPWAVGLAVASLPDVSQVQVSYRLPHHVAIRVQEREAILTWQVGDQRFAVDAAGLLLSARPETTLSITIQQLDTPAGGGPALGQRVDPEAVAAARSYAELLPAVTTFAYTQVEGLSAVVGGQRVILGDGEWAPAKVTLLGALLERLAERGIAGAYIDLRYRTPYYRLGAEEF